MWLQRARAGGGGAGGVGGGGGGRDARGATSVTHLTVRHGLQVRGRARERALGREGARVRERVARRARVRAGAPRRPHCADAPTLTPTPTPTPPPHSMIASTFTGKAVAAAARPARAAKSARATTVCGAFDAELVETAAKITRTGCGIMAMDESNGTCGQRLDSIGVENTEENRQRYRELLITTQVRGRRTRSRPRAGAFGAPARAAPANPSTRGVARPLTLASTPPPHPFALGDLARSLRAWVSTSRAPSCSRRPSTRAARMAPRSSMR